MFENDYIISSEIQNPDLIRIALQVGGELQDHVFSEYRRIASINCANHVQKD